MQKRVFRHMATAKVQISLCILTVWSGPSLSGNKIIGYYRMYVWLAVPDDTLGMRRLIWICLFWICSKALFRLTWPISEYMYHLLQLRVNRLSDLCSNATRWWGPLLVKKCLWTCVKFADSQHSAHAQSHPSICSPLINCIVSYESICKQQRPWSDYTDAQTYLGLCHQYIPEDMFWHGTAHVN